MAKLDAASLAQDYGFAYSFLKSDPSLYALFQQAVKGNWNQAKFTAELKNTTWYQRNAESVRQYNFLAKTDPATLAARRNAVRAQLQDKAAQMGAAITPAMFNTIAQNALMYNWNDSQIQDVLSGYVHTVNGVFTGGAADTAERIRQKAWRNGVSLPEATVQTWVQGIAAGDMTMEGATAVLQKSAKSIAPAYAAEIDAGMDLYDIASPYMQSMAKILEIPPAKVDLFDPTIRSALSQKDSKGQATSKTLWQFENDLRQDPRWTKTQNAQDSMMTNAKKVLTDMGFA